jgi:hypothetical protein
MGAHVCGRDPEGKVKAASASRALCEDGVSLTTRRRSEGGDVVVGGASHQWLEWRESR